MDKIEISKQLTELIQVLKQSNDMSEVDKIATAALPALIAIKEMLDTPMEEQIRGALERSALRGHPLYMVLADGVRLTALEEIAHILSSELSPQPTEPRYTVDEVVERIENGCGHYGSESCGITCEDCREELPRIIRAILSAATEDAG